MNTTTPDFLLEMQRSLIEIGQILGLSETDPTLILLRLIRIAASFLGIIFVLLIVWSGFQLMVSGGRDEQVIKAKKTFYNAIIGVIIILSSYSIVTFILQAFLPN